jgi:large subunit ribosomal protein L30e
MIDDIKKLLKTDKLLIGKDRVIKNLKLGNLEKIFLASNCSDELKQDVENYSKLANVKVVQLDIPNEELGAVCKKPFSISIIGFLK